MELFLETAGAGDGADGFHVAPDVVHGVRREADRAQVKSLEHHDILRQRARFVAEQVVDATQLFGQRRTTHDRLRNSLVAMDESVGREGGSAMVQNSLNMGHQIIHFPTSLEMSERMSKQTGAAEHGCEASSVEQARE